MLINDRVRNLLEIFNLQVTGVAAVPESNSSEVYLLTVQNHEKVILKIPRQQGKLERERDVLQLLENQLSVPKILAMYPGDEKVPGALLLSFLDGQPATLGTGEGEVTEKFAFQLGVLLATIHQNSLRKYFTLDRQGEQDADQVWIDYKKRVMEESIFFCKGQLPSQLLDRCQERLATYFRDFPAIDGPCLVHNDFRLGNILTRGSEVVGIIDFEIAGGGSADADFALIKGDLWDPYPGTKESMLAGYRTVRKVPDLEYALPFYLLHTAFSRVAWCVKKGRTGESYFRDFVEQIEELVEEWG